MEYQTIDMKFMSLDFRTTKRKYVTATFFPDVCCSGFCRWDDIMWNYFGKM
jgi:hypothetical protein